MEISLAAARQRIADQLAVGDAGAALDLIAVLRERFPRDYRLNVLSGRALLAKGDVDQARFELQRAAAAAPDDRDVHLGLASCGVEEAAIVAADLPPLAAGNGERPPISAAALGHLYLQQLLLTHCTTQLDPLWQARADRLDVGSAAAEAHWRLSEAEAAEEITRTLLALEPDCLKANLILAQMLWVSGQPETAAPLVSRAQELDPENEIAEELYEWLAVRDAGLVPVRRREVLVDVPEPAPDLKPGLPEPTRRPEPELREPVPEQEPSPVHGRGQGEGIEEPVLQTRATEAPEEPPASIDAVLAEPPTQVPAEEPAPFWERGEQPSPAAAGEGEGEGSQEPAYAQAIAEPAAADLAETAPEPPLASIEARAEHIETLTVEWLDVDHQGHARVKTGLSPERRASQTGCIKGWTASCGLLSERLGLGRLRTSSVDSDRGALQVVHHRDRAVVALAPPGANLGLIRARLRQSVDSSKERIPT